jgi:hypothetical protein
VNSAIINVAQDVDVDWALELYDHDGQAHHVIMTPGDMVLYESHKVIHGRPVPLAGRYYANLFVHFEPQGPPAHSSGTALSSTAVNSTATTTPATHFIHHNDDNDDNDSSRDEEGPPPSLSSLPPYLITDSPWAEDWRRHFPNGWVAPARMEE